MNTTKTRLDELITIVENCKSFADIKKLKYLPEFIAQGSTRMVFKVDNQVLKVSKNILGLVQSLEETRLNGGDNFLLDIVRYNEDGLWLVMPYANVTKPKKVNGICIKQWFYYACNISQEVQRKRPLFTVDAINQIKLEENCELRDTVYNLLAYCNLLHGDIFKKDSLGFYDGELKLVDYGFTKQTEKFMDAKIKTPRTIAEAIARVNHFYGW